MAAPVIYLTIGCCGCFGHTTPKGSSVKSTADKVFFATVTFDIFAIITALVIGILGLKSMIAIPAAAAYACLGASFGIMFLWSAVSLFAHFVYGLQKMRLPDAPT